ncbi:MAG: RNase adapter RapZ [Elusimicrobia bacterium]|nr:RNase adapter RapZ [Elusimicrobiota bacterium]
MQELLEKKKKNKERPELIIISGLSGAGKSVAIKSIEDFGGFCVDNMPPALIEKFIRLIKTSDLSRSLIALGIDARSRGFLDSVFEALPKIKKLGYTYRIIFLFASESVIERRYSESRYRHPLSSEGLTLKETVSKEADTLAPLRERADIKIDTSHLSPHELKAKLRDIIFKETHSTMQINLISFGFKYGLPEEADLVMDTRFLPNPFYEPELSAKDGTDPGVRDFVMKSDLSQKFLEEYFSLIDFLLPNFIKDGRAFLNIAVGCTGGRHRSVVISSAIAEKLKKEGQRVRLIHRDSSRCR